MNVTLKQITFDSEITQILSANERFERIAADYVALPPEERAQTRVIASTHHARTEINRRIRDRLGLTRTGEIFLLLTRKDLSDAQLRTTWSYDEGDMVQAELDYPWLRLKRHDFAVVMSRREHKILLKRRDGTRVAWQPAANCRFGAFVPEARHLAEGELVQVTANDRGHGLVKGELARVTGLESKSRMLTLSLGDRGTVITLDGSLPLPLEHGYCSALHGVRDPDWARVMIESDTNSLQANYSSLCIAISRAREASRIYTDDWDTLPQLPLRDSHKAPEMYW